MTTQASPAREVRASARAAVPTIFGTATGLVVWSIGAGVGLSAALLAVPAAHRALLVGGGLTLAVIGARTLRTTRRGVGEVVELKAEGPNRSRLSAYVTGLATNLGNPKAGVFAISLLPAFAGTRDLLPTIGLGIVWAAVTATWYLLFVLLVARGRAFVTTPRAQKAIGYVSGVVLVVVGGSVAFGL
ncbi:LysE family translocator [Humibacillus xanthopallidus]|uniref:LysE family translocator n=1 Tax=Humibacillus xanthopallidus TaxID=412689 RepID=UPI0011503E87|nr:LysE family translocator [Humibacillus xanthopallidus]